MPANKASGSQGSSEIAYEAIRRAIVEGRYRPGQRLVEQRLGEEFTLSRTPVREALRRLETEGLVNTERNRGASVRALTAADIVDLYELRARLESLAAEQAAERASLAQHAAIDEAAAAFEDAVQRSPSGLQAVRRMSQANQRFHGAIVGAASHPRLERILARTVDVPLVFRAFRQFHRAEAERSATFHRLIRDAVVERQPDRAGRLMTEHILQGRDVLLARLDENGSVDKLFR